MKLCVLFFLNVLAQNFLGLRLSSALYFLMVL